jgi:hypothetical protein
VIAAQLKAEGLGNALARQIVLGGAEASGKDDDVSAGERNPARLEKMLETVADDGFEDDFDPKLIETPGQEQGISVLAKGRQEFGADSYDLSIHGYQCKPNALSSWNFA